MPTHLGNVQFSFRSDIVENLIDGLLNDSAINTQGGNDILRGKAAKTIATTDPANPPLSYGLRNTATGQLVMTWGNDILSGEGIIGLENAGLITTHSGNDVITARGSQIGLSNLSGAIIDLSHGDDRLEASGAQGLNNLAGAKILMGTGNDAIVANGQFGLINQGRIDLDHGNDSIVASGGPGSGLDNLGGQILMGTGDDSIRVGGRFFALNNWNQALIDTGFGNDRIEGFASSTGISNDASSMVLTGGNDDLISGVGGLRGISNQGQISMGFGNDNLVGYSVVDPFFSSENIGVGIYNTGHIDLGGGDDGVKGIGGRLTDGITGGGTIDLGSGNDRFSAFGDQVVDGGWGFDLLLLDGSFDQTLQRNLPSFAPGGPFGISLGSLPNSFVFSLVIPFSQLATEMTVINFEEFRLAGRTFSAQELRGILSA